eukprot:TRINITY_DN40398_c0_g1_i1.p1 TRINITY_DN40398_c0_g1~~TRINITY_DN40398_c0_g1_i1.p1  ORF type:complete len:218 (-),score=42.91 TRINITY_DN40398_c0_g1_i1:63-716(-)
MTCRPTSLVLSSKKQERAALAASRSAASSSGGGALFFDPACGFNQPNLRVPKQTVKREEDRSRSPPPSLTRALKEREQPEAQASASLAAAPSRSGASVRSHAAAAPSHAPPLVAAPPAAAAAAAAPAAGGAGGGGQPLPGGAGAADIFDGAALGKKPRDVWTEAEERRLARGQQLYGNAWETIRASCDLRHKLGTQLRAKYRNLLKAPVRLRQLQQG